MDWKLIVVSARSHYQNFSWVRWIQSTLYHPICLITHLCFGLSGLCPSPYPTKILGLCHACPCLLILIRLLTLVIFGEHIHIHIHIHIQYKLLRFLVLNIVFSSTLYQCCFPLLGCSGLSKSIGCPGLGFLWFSAPFKVTVRLVIVLLTWSFSFYFSK